MPSIGGNVSSLRDVLPLPPGLADPSYAGRGERTADVMRARSGATKVEKK